MPSSGVQTCARSEEHTSELQSHDNLVCRLLLEKNNSLASETVHVTAEPTQGSARRLHGASRRRPLHSAASCEIGQQRTHLFALFFLKYRGPPKFYPFPLPAAFRI